MFSGDPTLSIEPSWLGRALRRSAWLLAVLLSLGVAAQELLIIPSPQPPPRLPSLRAFQDHAARRPGDVVIVEATLTRNWGPNFFIQDEGAGCFVLNRDVRSTARSGDRVEVTGHAELSGRTPHLVASSVRIIGPGTIPEARLLSTEEAASGEWDARHVALRGRLTGDQPPVPNATVLFLGDAGISFPVEAPDAAGERASWPAMLLGQSVEVTGVLSVRGPRDNSPHPFRLLTLSRGAVTILAPPPWWMPPRVYNLAGIVACATAAALVWVIILRRQVRKKTAELRERYELEASFDRNMREAQKLESLGVLAGGIAHDFNNLLTVVLGHASLGSAETPAGTPLHQSFKQIEQAAERAADLCRQMLAYSGRGRFVTGPVNLNALVLETVELLRASVSKKARLELIAAPKVPMVEADATQLRQILMNLVINASEALGETGGSVIVSTGYLSAGREMLDAARLGTDLPEGNYAWLEVRDTGSGMDAETQARVFEPFFTTKFAGRGLGLAAVLGIVRSHRGALELRSAPGEGSTFRLLLPVTTATPTAPVEIAHRPPPSTKLRGTVMVVDDEEAVRTAAVRMISSYGCRVVTASDGVDALSKYRGSTERIAAVLLDLTMPEMDGLATFHALRKLQPDLPVVLMSGFTEEDALTKFAGERLTGFLQKPFRPESLRAKLETVLRSEEAPTTSPARQTAVLPA